MYPLLNRLNAQPTQIKLFILLILLRPVLDIFWDVKDTAPLFSPLIWAGALPVILIAIYFIKSKSKLIYAANFQSKSFSAISFSKWLFIGFSFLILLNVVGIVFSGFVSKNLEILQSANLATKLISLPLFFIYLYTSVNKDNFDLILKFFLFSSLLPYLMIIYEILSGPINSYTPGGRDFERYRGLYSDGINYTIYWLIGLISSAYFYLKNNNKINFIVLSFLFALSTISLFFLNQAVAYIIFTFLLLLVLLFVFRNNKVHFLFLVSLLLITVILLYIPNYQKFSSLFGKEAEIVKGNLDLVHGANGRIWIWLEGLKQLKEYPLYSWLVGAGLTDIKSFNFFTAGAHSDYLRMIYSAGVIGLLLYIVSIFTLFKGFPSLQPFHKFLILSVISSLFLFSVTHTPTIYMPYVYFIATTFAYFSKRMTTREA